MLKTSAATRLTTPFVSRTLLSAIACRLGQLLSSGSVTFTPEDASSARSGTDSPPQLQGSNAGLRTKPSPSSVNRKVIGYVRQDDSLLPYLTVRETLRFAASLRLARSVNKRTRDQIVQQTIDELGLRDAADTIVGGPFRKGISGGEKRRLSIGCVLVTLPSVLVLDEPTTGLDAFTAYALLETLSNLARRGRTVILSIHQPRSDAFPIVRCLALSHLRKKLNPPSKYSSIRCAYYQAATSSTRVQVGTCSRTFRHSDTRRRNIRTRSTL